MKRHHVLWMQAIVWLLLLLIRLPAPVQATSPVAPAQTLQVLEESLFATHYDQDPMDSRLSRLEQTVFGQAQTGLSTEARLARLQKVLPQDHPASPEKRNPDQAAVNSLPPLQPESTHRSPPEQGHPAQAGVPPHADATDYPVVTQMEQKVFGQAFLREDLTQRLARLEKQVFQNTQNGSLADRTDNLRLVVLGDTPPAIRAPLAYIPVHPDDALPLVQSNSTAGQPGIGSLNDIQSGQNVVTPDMIAAIGQVEKEVIGQQFPAEPFPMRLDRVETKIFHATSPELSPEERMQRIFAVASAGGTPESPSTRVKHTLQTLIPIILTILPLILL